ncbi:Transmembrane domain of uncharacterised function (DUF3566) [Gordonia paraffinivorans]|uniref:Transmembrane domain of uncharacterized function (DUF3566) n=1 Tax=Gordonia paraffinivorans TaxID=175628 RepID=A0ABD7V3N5_9ACTN|nr:DUF3566 domain-containing protein [Gordonia paraffinivorans]VFA88957.1 Transmembrane domain of uncharacterised function (DUF3566) [Gordonia paraffinivorans]
MSTPNEPNQDKNGRPAEGQSGPGTGTPGGGLVPPWQRGPAEDSSGSAPTEAFDRSPQETRSGQENRGGPPPRGIVTTAGGPAAGGPGGQQAPVTKLDSPRRPAPATATEDTRFVESPTSTIERDDLPEDDLPDLDRIHHTADLARPAGAATGAKAAPRSAPRQVGAGTALRATVQVRRIDPWATFKISAVLSVVGFFIWMIAVAVLYLVFDGMGIWDQLNNSFGTLVAEESTSSGDIIGAGTVFGLAALLGAVNAILITALATVGSYIYNICADMVGGTEVTLADLD